MGLAIQIIFQTIINYPLGTAQGINEYVVVN